MLKSRSVSVVEEKRILIGLITSSKFIKEIYPTLDLNYFVNSYLRTVANWCLAFYEEHQRAPFKHIQDIYEAESTKLKETEAELISDLITLLSEQYDPETVNVDYLKDTSIDYFRKRELEIVVNNISVLKENGDYDEAESEIERFRKVSLELSSSSLINLGDIDKITEIYQKREKEDKQFFHLPGDLGKYLGNFKRGDVIGYYAPAKRGKSWTLVDHFKQSVLQRRKTIFWSIEMTQTEITPRILKAFKPMTAEEGIYEYPVFDCKRNQSGDCVDRLSPVIVFDGDDIVIDPAHIPCTICKGNNTLHEFDSSIYQMEIFRDQDDIFTVTDMLRKTKRSRGLSGIFSKYGRLAVHPKYTLTYEQMKLDIDRFEAESGFIPDVLIIDYIDILDIGSKFDDYRSVDEAWKLLARIAGEYNVLVVTATQANKAGHKAETLDSTHQGGYYGKNQHVNTMVGINQTAEEKEMGIIKYGITEARSQHYIPGEVCTVLQDFKSGQAYLDSYYPFK